MPVCSVGRLWAGICRQTTFDSLRARSHAVGSAPLDVVKSERCLSIDLRDASTWSAVVLASVPGIAVHCNVGQTVNSETPPFATRRQWLAAVTSVLVADDVR